MIKVVKSDIITPELEAGAIYNDEFVGFHDDYLVLHCLLRMYKPTSVFEIGTNMGTGTQIIKNAVPNAKVFSLDLPTELAHISLQHPISEGKGDMVGTHCKLPYTQLRGDSMTFDYSKYPCEAYFIDGEHDFDHPFHESRQVLLLNPKLVVWHDADNANVEKALTVTFMGGWAYTPYRVVDTRIAFALKTK